jgi:arylsulfatase A-like enzyme
VKPLNIVYLHAHDLGRYCQPYGYDIPNVQRLAESGVIFRQAFCAAPTCSASRSALVTGRWPHGNGMFGLASEKWGYTLNDYSQHVARFLKRQGYDTALAGVQHVARKPWADPEEVLGYDRFLNHVPTPNQIHDPERSAAAAAEYIAGPHERPFFLSVGFLEPHRDNNGDGRTFSQTIPEEPADLDARYVAPMPHLPDTPVTRRETANFRMGVEIMDRKMGTVLDAIDRAGLRDSTLVICTTDHGPGFPEMKCTLTDRGIGVMLILRGPEGTGLDGGKVSDAQVSHVDLYPTVCELLGLERPGWLQGESLLPLVRGEREEVREAVFAELSYHGRYRPLRAARTKRYKYIRCFDPGARWGVDRGPAQELWEEHGYGQAPHPEEELFDLLFDPNEANNLADRGTHGQVLEEMRGRLREWMESTADPILGDGVPPPPGWEGGEGAG